MASVNRWYAKVTFFGETEYASFRTKKERDEWLRENEHTERAKATEVEKLLDKGFTLFKDDNLVWILPAGSFEDEYGICWIPAKAKN